MAILNQVCVYCGSSVGEDLAYAESARLLGRALARARIRLVYGGGSVGLMGIIARTVLDEGGAVTGIIPRFLEKRERVFPDVSELIVTKGLPRVYVTNVEGGSGRHLDPTRPLFLDPDAFVELLSDPDEDRRRNLSRFKIGQMEYNLDSRLIDNWNSVEKDRLDHFLKITK